MGRILSRFLTMLNQVWVGGRRTSNRGRRFGTSLNSIAIQVEQLDPRQLLSAANVLSTIIAEPTLDVEKPLATAAPTGLTPSQLLTAYGFNSVALSSGANGTGQTIAIVDAYDDPTIKADLAAFDAAYGIANPPNFTVMSQTGSTTSLPSTDPSTNKQSDWEVEESLDVEWAHALAPGANIVLVEANSASYSDLFAAVRTAANLPGVSVVSMSWGGSEFSSEAAYDSVFTTPTGHQGVTFVASTGDNAEPGGYPAFSPNVLAVGGTTLKVSSTGAYISETAWSDSGGGISQYETQPTYQKGVVTQTTTNRSIPDVSFDADPNSGVPVYDSFSNGATHPWAQIGGTSLSAPSWGAIVAIVNQARTQNGLSTLDGASQTLPMLYKLDQTTPSAFHDIVSGSNGASAGTGYDLVTGLGSPVVNLVVTGLSGSSPNTSGSKLVIQQSATSGIAGTILGSSFKVAVENSSSQIITTDNSKVTLTIASGPGAFATSSTVSATAVNGIATFNNLVLNTAGTYTIRASDGSLTVATSSALTISAGIAAKVAFVSQPAAATAGKAIPSAVTVAVEDLFGNIVTGNSSTVTISVASGPGSLATTSTLSVAAVNGIATFKNLILPTVGTYTLAAHDGLLVAANSNSFTVNGPLSSPQNVTISALTSTTAQLSWSAVAGTQGYRVFLVNGSQSTLIGTVASTVTTVQLTGLTAGSTASFKVEAYSGTTIADSSIVSVTLPANQLTGPTLTATVLSTTSVELDWTPIAGSQGYRIYWSDGTHRYLLTSVGAGVNRTVIVGLSSTATYLFQIESYSGTTVRDSVWVSVNSGTAQVHSASASAESAQGPVGLIVPVKRNTRR